MMFPSPPLDPRQQEQTVRSETPTLTTGSEDGRLVRRLRVPKRQKTVKIESLDRLHGARLLDALRKRAEPERLQRHDRGSVQERQVAEPVTQPIIAHRRLGVDVLFLRQPR